MQAGLGVSARLHYQDRQIGIYDCLARLCETHTRTTFGRPCGYHHIHLAIGQTLQDFPWGLLEHRERTSGELSELSRSNRLSILL